MNALSSNLNQFSNTLYSSLAIGQNENFFISPFSIFAVLSMCFAGAREDTSSQLKGLLKLDSLTANEVFQLNSEFFASLSSMHNDDVKIHAANKIYANQKLSIKPEFRSILTKFYQSEIETADFSQNEETAALINKWVSAKTVGKIEKLIEPNMINDLTQMILLNAIYFKGSWLRQFNTDHTQKKEFFLKDGNGVKQVDMMNLRNEKFKFQENPLGLPVATCVIPYKGESFSMTIILPNEGVNIDDVEKQLASVDLNQLLDHQNVYKTKVDISLPKFKITYQTEASEVLKEFIPDSFSPTKADFSGISESRGLFISKVVHKSFIEVNEEGTEAAAITGGIISLTSFIEPKRFNCNRPFIFVIQELKTNAILFMGKYLKPE